LINLLLISTVLLLAEVSLRLFSTSKYWVHTDRWVVGAGQTKSGKKWWPNTTFMVDSSEFHQTFRTNAAGYRARPGPIPGPNPYRMAFVGDSFTEGMQVAYVSTFCARLESILNERHPSRPIVCENFGISATDLLEYWHRITHDVIPDNPPDALVLCIYPGNDFQCAFPDDAFSADETPLREYYQLPRWTHHFRAWINFHSKVGSYVLRSLLSIGAKPPLWLVQGPKNWWTDPELAARAHDAPVVRRSRAILRAIDNECRQSGVALCILVVGPVPNYKEKNGQSPLARMLADWHVDIPVIDVATKARAKQDHHLLQFPLDCHLNEAGHEYVAQEAAPALKAFLAPAGLTQLRSDRLRVESRASSLATK
jgi:hypothetical protein